MYQRFCISLVITTMFLTGCTTTTPTAPNTPTPTLTSSALPSSTQESTSTPTVSSNPSNKTNDILAYDIGNPIVKDYWISPQGDNNNVGDSTHPFQTFEHAWNMIPANQQLTTGYRIHLTAGSYAQETVPSYLENRLGTLQTPIILQGEGNPIINGGLNVFNTKYFYITDIQFHAPGDVLHFEKGDHILLRNLVVHNTNKEAQETIKMNQSQHIYIEHSDISGAYENAIDFVAVEYGHIINNKIHDADDWCAYLKGGSAYFIVAGNEIYNCGTGGFTAGQGAGIEFMTIPWVHYEAYDIKIYNNSIHDTDGAGIGVNGGYNILIAHNTLYKVGKNSHGLEVAHGRHTCDGNTEGCNRTLAAGGWGSLTDEVLIGDKNIYIYNNILYNPAPYQSQWQHFAIYGPFNNPASAKGPKTAFTDSNLQIKGNIIWNGPADFSLGLDEDRGCQPSNPTCNATQILRDNTINTLQPQLLNPEGDDFHLAPQSNILTAKTFPIPDFSWNDIPDNKVPEGNLKNSITTDFENNLRTNTVAGAFIK